jgi:hypothetical protein
VFGCFFAVDMEPKRALATSDPSKTVSVG